MDIYARRKGSSLHWFNKSSDLRASAAALWMSRDGDIAEKITETSGLGKGFSMEVAVSPVFHMLCGMSMELILKAVVVERGQVVNETTHDLLLHLSMSGMRYSDDERKLLKILTHAATWAGRYPTPKKEAQMEDYHDLIRNNLYDRIPNLRVLRPNGALSWESFNAMWSKASDTYFSIYPHHIVEQGGPQSPA